MTWYLWLIIVVALWLPGYIYWVRFSERRYDNRIGRDGAVKAREMKFVFAVMIAWPLVAIAFSCRNWLISHAIR